MSTENIGTNKDINMNDFDLFEEVRASLPEGSRWLYETLENKINEATDEDLKYELGQKQLDILLIYM